MNNLEPEVTRENYYDQLYDIDFLSDTAYEAQLEGASATVHRMAGPDWQTWSSDALNGRQAAELWNSFLESNLEEGLQLIGNARDDSAGWWLLVQLLTEEMYRSGQSQRFHVLNRILASADRDSIRLKAEKLGRAHQMLASLSQKLEMSSSVRLAALKRADFERFHPQLNVINQSFARPAAPFSVEPRLDDKRQPSVRAGHTEDTGGQASCRTGHPVVRTLSRHAARWASQHCEGNYTVDDVKVEDPVREDWERQDISIRDREAVEQFYRDTCSYVLELTAANHQVETLFNYNLVLNYLRRLGISHLYDYGAGIGTFAIFARLFGMSATYADLDSKTRDYARDRFQDFGFDVPARTLDSDSLMLPSNLECVVCTEVLEHVFEPEVLVKTIHRALRPGGVFVVSESFDYVNEFSTHLPQHKGKGGEEFIRWIDRVGFRKVSLPFHIHPSIHVKV